MHTSTRFLRRVGALCLATILTLGATALAVEPTPAAVPTSAQQLEDLNYLYDTLASVHPNLFANTKEADFLARKAEIAKNLPAADAFSLAVELQSLVALAGDSHTSISFGDTTALAGFYPMAVDWYDGHWYLSAVETKDKALLGLEVISINDSTVEQVVEAFGKIVSHDNPVKLRRGFSQMCNVTQFYTYLGLANQGEALTLTLKDAQGKSHVLEVPALASSAMESVDVVTLSKQAVVPATDYNRATDKSKNYFARVLDKDTYYIQYNSCLEDKAFPMETFAKQVEVALAAGAYQRVVLDLRNNGGGSDGVIWPLVELLRQEMDQKGTELVGLIGETTFSSAIINAVELQEMGGVLVGEATSGSVSHFGSVKGFVLPNSDLQVRYSTKYIDMGTLMESAVGKGVEPLLPDVAVAQPLTDFLAGKDTAVAYLLTHKEPLAQAVRPDAPLTRGRFVGLLYEAAGSPAVSREKVPFKDNFGIEWYLPAVAWAVETGISNGTSATTFSSTRPVTWQEAAVLSVRAAQVLAVKPDVVRQGASGLTGTPRTKDAVETAWSWGVLDGAGGNLAAPMNRQQGAQLLQTLFQK